MNHKSTRSFSLLIAGLAAALAFALPTFAETGDVDFEAEIADAMTELEVKAMLLEKIGWDMLTVDVEVDGARATLAGSANNRANQEMARQVALSVEGIEEVANNLTVETEETNAPIADAVADAELEIKDAVLESRVKARLIAEMGTNAFGIDVEAASGEVSLRGELSGEDHRRIALQTAENCNGVDSVVDLLSIQQAS